MADDIIFLLASFIAAVVATLAGFGSSTLLIPVGMLFMEVRTAVFLVACFHLFNNLFKIKAFWRTIDRPTAIMFGIPSIVFAFIGARLMIWLPVEGIKVGIGAFLIIFSLLSLLNVRISMRRSPFTSLAGGSLSGLLAGLIGLGGALRSMFLISMNLTKEYYIGTAAVIAGVVDLTRIPTYLFSNVVTDYSKFVLLPFLLVTAYAGVRVGKLLLHRISQKVFRRVVFVALFLTGVKLIF